MIYLAGVSSFFSAAGPFSMPCGVLGVFGAPGTLDAPGVLGLDGVAGGPIGAEPEPVPSFFGTSEPGVLAPGCAPGTGDVG
jgi:hypothetical protein